MKTRFNSNFENMLLNFKERSEDTYLVFGEFDFLGLDFWFLDKFNCKRGGIHNIFRPVLLAISHRRNMFPLVLRSAGQPITSIVHNPKWVDLVVGCSVLYCAALPVIRALSTVSHPSINNRLQQHFQ